MAFEECSLLLPLYVEMMTEVEELQRAARDQEEKATERKHTPRSRQAIFWHHALLRKHQ